MTDLIIKGPEHDLGHGLIVSRSLPTEQRRMVGPFIFWDHAGPVVLDPALKGVQDVRPHPHVGLATLSYLFSGAIMHRDNLGCEQLIRPGEVNWMTAGRGIVHSERFDDASAFTHPGVELLQSWVALPAEYEEIDPAITHFATAQLPQAGEAGVALRLVAGAALGLQSPVLTYSPLFYLHARLDPGRTFQLPAEYSERAAYVVHGRITVDGRNAACGVREMIVFDHRQPVLVRAAEHSEVMFLGGEPLGKRYIWWNFVSSRRERIVQAAADWQAGRFRLPDSDNQEFTPLPDRPLPTA
ncbi:MAG: pirin family protein [Gammaproteobacteria bacterium]|nr:pirin family protein [Gammaproteobacteria bacterium]